MRADRFVGASKGAVRAVLLGLFILGAACLLVPPAISQLVCPGDCNWNGVVSIDEIIVAVNIALGLRNRHDCPPGRRGQQWRRDDRRDHQRGSSGTPRVRGSGTEGAVLAGVGKH